MKLSDIEFRATDSWWRKLFEFFCWGHPDSDFGIQRMEQYLKSHGFNICNKQWTPLLTMVRAERL